MTRALTVLLAAVALLLAACGSDDQEGGVPEDEPFNDADVAFATDMIPHHAEAMAMVDLTNQRDVSPELAALAEQIRSTQAPEIETMADWLQDWGQPVPETMNDHANAEDHGDPDDMGGMHGMEGMVDLEELDSLQGQEFEDAWLEAMIEHHASAVEMAGTEVERGEDADAKDLARAIVDGQQAEIEQMQDLLAS